jgi:Resolvase, N terminal domain
VPANPPAQPGHWVHLICYDAATLRAHLTALQDAALSESAADLDSVRDHLAQVVSRALEPAHELVWASCHRLYTVRVVLLFAVRDPAGQLSALAGLPELAIGGLDDHATMDLLASLEPGDRLVCTKLDRIGRSVRNLMDVSNLLRERGVDLVCLDQPIDTMTAQGKLFFTILAAFAEFSVISTRRDGHLPEVRAAA